MPKLRRKKDKQARTEQDYELLGRMLTNIYETGYIDRNQAYKMTFIKGILRGLGTVIGATIVAALLLWTLSLFDSIPIIDRVINNIETTIDNPAQ